MDLLKTILSATNGGATATIASKLGLNEADAAKVLARLAPALGQGLAANSSSAKGIGGLLAALQKGNHQQYLEHPELAGADSGVSEGNKILGHILGSKDASRALAGQVAEDTGISGDLIKRMLPMVATLAMGALSQQTARASDPGSLGSMLGGLLGGDGKGGSPVNDLLGMAGKLFKL